MHEGTAAPTKKGGLRRLRDTPIVEAGAAVGYGPVFNAGLLHFDPEKLEVQVG